MEQIVQVAQPYVGTIVEALVGLLALLVLTVIASLRKKVEAWLEVRTSAAQREILHKVAAEAYAYVEREYKDNGGPQKLSAAVNHVLERISLDKLGVTATDVEAAVQRAWTEFDRKNKQ